MDEACVTNLAFCIQFHRIAGPFNFERGSSVMKHFIRVFFLLVLMAGVSHAQPITANVIGAKVGQKGLLGAEYRSGYE